MPPRATNSASISFGLVAIPVQVFPAATGSAGISFHLLHAKDGVRLKQQYVCPKDDEVVGRGDADKGYEFEKGRYVTFTNEELKALDQAATHGIEVREFVPPGSVDPVHFERTDYLGPGKGGDKAFALFTRSLEEMDLVAIAEYAARGKAYLVLLRPNQGRLAMHQLLHADEVRPIEEIAKPHASPSAGELKMARQLIEQMATQRFDASRYSDEVRARVRELIERKVEGADIVEEAPAEAPRGKVVDLMDALKASLEGGRQRPRPAPKRTATASARPRRRRASGPRGSGSPRARTTAA
jgi:DNA end-binding protein Ku